MQKREQLELALKLKKQTVEIRVDHISENNANNSKQQKITVKKISECIRSMLKEY